MLRSGATTGHHHPSRNPYLSASQRALAASVRYRALANGGARSETPSTASAL
jgi:hypothetical protein